MKKEIIEIEVKADGAIQDIKGVNSELKNTGDAAKSANTDTKGLGTSALASAKSFSVMGVSINSVSAMLKVLKVSLIATGIGAIVVAVGALAAAFLSTQKGVDALNSVLTPLKTVLATIWGIAQKLGDGLFQMVNGDISKGFDTMAKSVENVGGQLKAAVARGEELAALLIRIEERAVNQSLVLSRLNRHYAEQLEIAEDINRTEDERRAAFKNAIASQEAITKLKVADLAEQIKAIKIGEEDNDTNREAQRERNELIATQENIEADGFKARTLLQKKLNVVKGETLAIDKATTEERKKATGINGGATGLQTGESPENAKLRFDLETKELIERQANERLAGYKAEWQAEELENEQRIVDAKVALQFELASQIGNALGAIGQLFEQGTAASKVAALAEIVIGTGIGFIQGLDIAQKSAKATGPGAAFAFPIFYATQIAAVLGAASKAKNILSQVKGGGSANIGGAPQQAQAPQFNVVGSSGTNQLASAIGGQSQKPIKTYVVANEVVTQAAMDRNIVNAATFGG